MRKIVFKNHFTQKQIESELNFAIPCYMFNMVHDEITQMNVLAWMLDDGLIFTIK
jgi:hypothetical protein